MAHPGGSGAGAGPIVGSAPGPSTATANSLGAGPNASGYFNQPYLQAAQAQPHSYAAPSHMPARSPYTDSQNFMPSTQHALSPDDNQTYQNTLANAQAAAPQATPASQTHHIPSSTLATGGRDSPAQQQQQHFYSASNAIEGASDIGGANANHNHSTMAAVNGRFNENWDASQRGSSILDGDGGAFSDGGGSGVSGTSTQLPTRSNTLKKKSSLRRASSLHRSSSRRSMKAGSVRSLALQSRSDGDESNSAFYCPVPTKGNPTEVLAGRFQAWRKILKDLISYHREIQNHYEQRAKSVQRLATTLNGTILPPGFMTTGGLDDASQTLRNFHKQAVAEAVKARDVEEDVILALTGLRTDLSQKIKEIKNISGDFRNNVDKEMDATKKAVKNLQDNLGQAELDSSVTTGRQDPYLLRLLADRQLERQIQEENYLHQAFLNLEKSGRELESIVVGEIQKSYNAYVGILRREADATWNTTEELREGPIAMPKDQEWLTFIRGSDQFIGPDIPIRSFQFLTYPGQNHFACQEIRAGLLERKSKYLKSYTAGWYVLSPTHLHEFKSADKMQAPVMSLYLPEQKLGSHSNEGASSSKFVLKGRQTGGLHRGHTWVFRAESFDTMMAWFDDLYVLTEKTPQERENFARGHQMQHTRSISRASQHTYSSDGVVNEDDDEPFAVNSPAAMAGAAAGAKAAEDATAGQTAGPADQPGNSAAGIGAPPAQASVVDQTDPGIIGGTANEIQTPATGVSSQYRSQSAASSGPSRRPSQGGRFPSDLQVNAQRGLEVQAAGIPVSPTSAGGSGSQRGSATAADSTYGHLGPSDTAATAGVPAVSLAPGSDYGVIAAAGQVPGSQQHDMAPDNYDNNYNSNYGAYGVTAGAGALAGVGAAYGAESAYDAPQQQRQQQEQREFLAQKEQTEREWQELRDQQEQLRLDQQRLREQQEQQRHQLLLVQQQKQQQQQQQQQRSVPTERPAQPAQPAQSTQPAAGTSQAALASQAQQAPATVAPVIPMFVNINEKSDNSKDNTNNAVTSADRTATGTATGTGSGKAFDSSSAVPGGVAGGVLGGAALGATGDHGYSTGVAREQQVYRSNSQQGQPSAEFTAVGNGSADPTKSMNAGARPSLADRTTSSGTTLSHLHVPGEFPKTSTESR
ncbi:PH domain containing protein [Sporothrix schenckii 1099-18]|uniref:PH domain containing protein n=1 Tax=Sporothrix schenckii 1099-18 TaxID=1397361 RepID=A0A0F2M331_SPOSC|nr:PH domain containing protein [Sporothrix schenckii 1099-18]KJR83504.1 PH domain containing protein [Sporothrix schenckii 1099-18]